jgi:hypothetical protein
LADDLRRYLTQGPFRFQPQCEARGPSQEEIFEIVDGLPELEFITVCTKMVELYPGKDRDIMKIWASPRTLARWCGLSTKETTSVLRSLMINDIIWIRERHTKDGDFHGYEYGFRCNHHAPTDTMIWERIVNENIKNYRIWINDKRKARGKIE